MLDGWRIGASLWRSGEMLCGHGIFILATAALLTGAVWLRSTTMATGDAPVTWLWTRFFSLAAFGLLGFSIAFVLALGIDVETGKNAALALIGIPLVTLVAGGIAVAQGATSATGDRPLTAILSFLISFLLCYQALFYQLTRAWPN